MVTLFAPPARMTFQDESLVPPFRDNRNSTPSPELLEQLLELARASALEEMASGIAHELNQPLGAIATYSQAGERMLRRPVPMVEGAADVLKQISQEAMAAGEGLRRIRRLFDRGQRERSLHALQDIVAELEPVLDLLAERSGARLVVKLKPDLPLISVDSRQIQHVLFVLVLNAIEASRDSGDQPSILIESSSDGYSVETAVVDRGAGIPAAARSRIFHPFFTTKAGGTGLGLVSSRTIVDAHEGTIGFDDVPGGGTRFWFRLPAVSK